MLIRALWPCFFAAAAFAQPETPPADPPAPAPEMAPAQPEPPAPKSDEPEPDEEREAVVILRDGQRYTGTLVSRDDKAIVLKIAGIDTTIKTSLVERVQFLPSVMERYRQMRAAIDDTDVEGLLRLVAWLRSKAKYDAALAELDHVVSVQPDHPGALELKTQIEAQRELARSAGRGTRPPPPKDDPRDKTESAVPLLSERDINLIKVYEIDLTDPPRIVIDRDTIKAMIEEHEGDPLIPGTPEGRNALYRANPVKLLDIMFRMQARNLYERVKVIDQPRSMKNFRDRVHSTWLINACATTQCHGGSEAGRFMLATERPRSDATVYTNFIILDRFKTSDGKPLIDYDKPESSLLLQMAMDKSKSRTPHPEVPGRQGNIDLFRPVFRSEDDPRFKDAVAWIKSMYRPRPEYPVQYTLPGPQGITVDPDAPPIPR